VLPNLDRAHEFSLSDYIEAGAIFSRLQQVRFTASFPVASAVDMHDIVGLLPNLTEMHIRLPSCDRNATYQMPSAIVRELPGQPCLLSMATRVTFQGCCFQYGSSVLEHVSLPALRALAVVECINEYRLFYNLRGNQFPQLKALMVKNCSCHYTRSLETFIQQVGPLRELILYGTHLEIEHEASITRHADTLEILSLRRRDMGTEFSVFEVNHQISTKTILKQLSIVRHLRCYIKTAMVLEPNGEVKLSAADLEAFGVRCVLSIINSQS